MLNEQLIKIISSRDYLKRSDNNSPKVNISYSQKLISENEYYKPTVELIYKIIKESEEFNNEKK